MLPLSASCSPELSAIAAESQSTPGWTGLDLTHMVWPWVLLQPVPRRLSLFAPCLPATHIRQEMRLMGDPRCGAGWAAALPSPGNACREESKNGLFLAQNAFWLCPDTNSHVDARISLDPTLFSPISLHHFLVSASPSHCTKFTSLPAAWSRSKCFQASVCSFGIGCETRHKILMGCVIILACCLFCAAQTRGGNWQMLWDHSDKSWEKLRQQSKDSSLALKGFLPAKLQKSARDKWSQENPWKTRCIKHK